MADDSGSNNRENEAHGSLIVDAGGEQLLHTGSAWNQEVQGVNVIRETRVQLTISRGSRGAHHVPGANFRSRVAHPTRDSIRFFFEVGYYLVFLEATRPELLYRLEPAHFV